MYCKRSLVETRLQHSNIIFVRVSSLQEAYIQRALEETDPLMAGPTEAQTTLLGNVPDDARHRFETNDDEQQQQQQPTNNTKTTTMPSFMGERRSTGDALWEMAAQMRKMQGRPGSSLSSKSSHIKEEEMSPGDMFAHNATTLLKRSRSAKAKESARRMEEQEEMQGPSPAKADPMAKWKKLKHAVQVAGAAASIKKDDEVPAPDDVDAETGEASGSDGEGASGGRKSKPGRMGKAAGQLKSEFLDFEEWLKFTQSSVLRYIKRILLFLIIPCTGVAALLFYAAGNPPCGTQEECIDSQKISLPGEPTQSPTMAPTIPALNGTNATEAPAPAPGPGNGLKAGLKFFVPDRSNQASVSWWLLFVGVRQVLTFTAAKATQAWLVDFLALRTRWFVKLFGPFITLLIVQSKGWPFLTLTWALYDFALLYGDGRFARHW